MHGPAKASSRSATLPANNADYIVVEIAKNVLGPEWLAEYVRRANSGGIERVLV